MKWFRTRTGLGVLAVGGLVALTLVVDAPTGGAASTRVKVASAPAPVLQLRMGNAAGKNGFTLVDGTDPSKNLFQAFGPDNKYLTLAATPQLVSLSASSTLDRCAGGPWTGPVSPSYFPGRLRLGVASYFCTKAGLPATELNGERQGAADSRPDTVRPGETLTLAKGADLPYQFAGASLNVQIQPGTVISANLYRAGTLVRSLTLNTSDPAVFAPSTEDPTIGKLALDMTDAFDQMDFGTVSGQWGLRGRGEPTPQNLGLSTFKLAVAVATGTIGPDRGTFQVPQTGDTPGVTVSCPDQGCGKVVGLTVSVYRTTIDSTSAQAFTVTPSGAGTANLLIDLTWAPEPAPTYPPVLPTKLRVLPTDPYTVRPICTTFAQPLNYCQSSFSYSTVSPGIIQVKDQFQGIDDPQGFRPN